MINYNGGDILQNIAKPKGWLGFELSRKKEKSFYAISPKKAQDSLCDFKRFCGNAVFVNNFHDNVHLLQHSVCYGGDFLRSN